METITNAKFISTRSDVVKVYLTTVSPELAKVWLAKDVNCKNRKANPKRIKEYAKDMTDGKWMMNGDAIRFCKDGTLMDGQHRLMAVVEAKKPLTTYLVVGLEREAGCTIDAGMSRSPRDKLIMGGYAEKDSALACKPIVSMINLAIFYNSVGFKSINTPSSDYIAKFFEDHKDSIESLYLVIGIREGKNRIANDCACLLAILCAIESGVSADTLKLWYDVVNTGFPSGKSGDTAAIRYRNYLLQVRGKKGSNSSPVKREVYLKAQNSIKHFCDNEGLHVLVSKECYPLPFFNNPR